MSQAGTAGGGEAPVPAPAAGQREAFDAVYGVGRSRWAFHDDPDPLVRYLRDRRLFLALERLETLTPVDRADWTVLVVCGGVGGEATWLLNNGFGDVTVADFSANALAVCAEREPRATTLELDAEGLAVGDSSYDLVLVQDGLHHLRRPVLGFTEMLRVARHAVVVIEPHDGLVGRLLGRTWEEHDGVRNYVFRWTGRLFEQATRAYLLDRPARVDARRLWDHNLAMGRLARLAGGGERGLRCAQRAYGALRPFDRFGNMMIGVTVIGDAAELDGTARKLIHRSRLRSPGWLPTDGLEVGGVAPSSGCLRRTAESHGGDGRDGHGASGVRASRPQPLRSRGSARPSATRESSMSRVRPADERAARVGGTRG